jgi:cytochrome oxidase Cu insertion factor (SCO1/SenC/PrrC family)
MADDTSRRRPVRLQPILVALLFLLPLAAAAVLYYGGLGWRPDGGSNHGVLLSPIVNLRDRLPDGTLARGIEDRWALVYINEGDCRETCRAALYKLRQSRLMLGKDMNRLKRVFLHGIDAPDTVLLDRDHRGMLALRESTAAALLKSLRPAGTDANGYYLLDPLGNVVMYFPAGIDPGDMVDDLSQLLELSRIG